MRPDSAIPAVNRLAALAGGLDARKRNPLPVDHLTESRSDHALMLAVGAGELDALGSVFERHHRPLFGFLAKLTGNPTAAEDIVQTVFQRMLKYRHTYRDDGS